MPYSCFDNVRDKLHDQCRPVIAVIDNNEVFRERLRGLLQTAGFTIALFGSAEEYLHFGASDLANCTILDVKLPGMGGLDLQSRLARLRHPTSLVFLADAYDDVRTPVRAMKAGAIDFFTRPFEDDELLSAVRSGLKRNHARLAEHRELEALRTRLASLSPREREIMSLLSAGRHVKQIAHQMDICTQTARVHGNRVMLKMGARSIVDLARMADKLQHPTVSDRFARLTEEDATNRPNAGAGVANTSEQPLWRSSSGSDYQTAAM
jgi:FixJ family two-component response regulator